MINQTFVLTLSCPNRPGIVAAVSTRLYEVGCNILDAQQFDDLETGSFFMRVVFNPTAEARDFAFIREALAAVADRFGMAWTLRDRAERRRVMLLASKFDHCLADLIHRWRIGELAMDVVAVVSNHPRDTYAHLGFGDVPFHHLPVSRQTKLEQETQLWGLIRESGAELVVLARYMQVLSDGLAAKLNGRCINIHHSFLPGFKGAKPYHQAHERGVKLIGATAHYVTSDLDEGPIIEQEVVRVDHSLSPDKLVAAGRDVECQALARSVLWHAESRILLNGHRTVVFR
jgi:formyltetrahydrofolate deformylase